jgi:hypothetical protein
VNTLHLLDTTAQTVEKCLSELALRSAEVAENKDGLQNFPAEEKFVPLGFITGFIRDSLARVEQAKIIEQERRPIEKFLFVEDGTVDTDELIGTLSIKNPEIHVVVYRQGGRPPEIIHNGRACK